MESIAKFLRPTKSFLLILGLFLLLSLLISSWSLNNVPVFGDEAIYVRWSQIIKNVETLRFIPLTDGKQPLYMWLTTAAFKFVQDPLIAGRLVALVAGLFTLVVAAYFSFLFMPKALVPVLLLFSFNFYTYFYNRLALADSLLSFFGIMSMLLAFLLSRYPRLDLSLITGAVLGLAWITKSPAIYFFVLFGLTYIYFSFPKRPLSHYLYPIISLAIGFFIYNLLRLGPQFHQIALRNQDYLWTLSEILTHPLDPLIPHFKDLTNFLWFYLGPAIFGLFLLPFYKHPKWLWPILAWWLIPTIGNMVFAQVLTARYLLYTIPPLLILLAYLYSKLGKAGNFILILLLIPSIFKIVNLNTNTFNFVLPTQDAGYLIDWTSGWGIKPASEYLLSRSTSHNVIVGTEGYFGTLPQGLEIYTDSQPRITIIGVGLGFDQLPTQLTSARDAGDEVYLLINRSRNHLDSSTSHQVRLIKSFAKPKGDFLDLYLLPR